MSELPEGWAEAELASLGSWSSGATPSTSNAMYWTGPIPWVSPKDLKRDFISDTIDHVSPAGIHAANLKLLPPGSLLFVVRGLILARTFPVALTRSPVTINQDIRALTPHIDLDAGYLFHALQHLSRDILHSVKEATHGTLRLDAEDLKRYSIRIPPVAEQRRIADKVHALLDGYSKAFTHLMNAGNSLRRFDESIANAAADGTLINASQTPTTTTLAKLLKEPLANGRSVVDDPSGFPVLRLNAITRRGIDLTQRKLGAWAADEAGRFLVRKNDFLVARGNGSLKLVGRGALIRDEPDPVAYPDTIIRVRTDHEQLDPRYLEIIWNSRAVRDQIEAAARTTAGIHKISQRDLERIEIPYIDPKMQQEIIRQCAALARVADAAIARVHAVTGRAEKLTQSILAKAFAGDLVPTEAEIARREGRSYEPASILLKRIRGTAAKTPAARHS